MGTQNFHILSSTRIRYCQRRPPCAPHSIACRNGSLKWVSKWGTTAHLFQTSPNRRGYTCVYCCRRSPRTGHRINPSKHKSRPKPQPGRQEPCGRAEPRHGIESSRLDRSRQSTGRPPAAMERAFLGVGCRALSIDVDTSVSPRPQNALFGTTYRDRWEEYPYFDQLVWPEIATTPGLPATAIPIDRSETGLPIGVQIVGPYLEDRTTIAFAELMEREFGGFVPPPGYAG